MKKVKQSSAINFLNRIIIALLALAVSIIIANSVLNIVIVNAENSRYNLTNYANGFVDASAYLTDEVRAYAATGDKEHYDNYLDELNVSKRRDKNVALLEKGGITEKERDMIEEMSRISDELVPYEREAMQLASQGDTAAALEIVYGDYYKQNIERIRTLRSEFLNQLNMRTSNEIKVLTSVYISTNVVIWALLIGIISLQVVQKRSLFRLAYVDPLTGSHNYNAFKERMLTGTDVCGSGYIVSMDLRDFSIINNTCGILKGNELIAELGRVLKDNMAKGELAAHVGGDIFVMFMHAENEQAFVKRLEKIKEEISQLSYKIDVPHIAPKFGIRAVESPAEPELGFGDANFAKAQLAGKADRFYAFFDEKTQEERRFDQSLEDNFAQTLKERRFEMWYQPQYSVKDGKFIAAEALVRWRNPDGSIKPPKLFIPLFERNGMIAQLDECNFESVCAQIRRWTDEGYNVVPISVNVSRSSLYYRDIVERYMEIVNRYGVPTNLIKIEITESAVVSSEFINEAINKFRSYGFRILIDDFGSGYSSLYLLTKDCYDNIKIDKSIIDCIGSPAGEALLKSIIGLAHQFNMTITAEGVEEKAQVDFLAKHGCDIIQGYYYSRPLEAAAFTQMLKK